MYHSLQELREENRILDAYEEWEYDEEQEAISLANSQNNESDTVSDDNFDFDVPVNENDNIDLPDFEPPKLSSQNGSAIDIPIDGVLQSESDKPVLGNNNNSENVHDADDKPAEKNQKAAE